MFNKGDEDEEIEGDVISIREIKFSRERFLINIDKATFHLNSSREIDIYTIYKLFCVIIVSFIFPRHACKTNIACFNKERW